MAFFGSLKNTREWQEAIQQEQEQKEKRQKCLHDNLKEHGCSGHWFICQNCDVDVDIRTIVRLQNERIKKLEEALANFIQ